MTLRWREGVVPGGDTRFWVREAGRGDDLVVLLHGFPHHGGSWAPVAADLVARGWRVAAPDLKGVGRTRTTSTDYDPRTLADELSRLVRNLHARRAVLVGHDWGGAVALATAFRHPGRVGGVVLVGSPYRRIQLRRAWHVALCNVPVLPEVAFRAVPRSLVRMALLAQGHGRDAVDRRLVADGAAALAVEPGAWLRYFRTLSRRAVIDDRARRVRQALPVADPLPPPLPRVPVTVVWGERDPTFPLPLGREVADDLGAELVVVPGVGHHVPVEAPSALAEQVDGLARRSGLRPAPVAADAAAAPVDADGIAGSAEADGDTRRAVR